MFSKLKGFIGKVVSKLFPKSTIQKELNIDISMSDEMSEAISVWTLLYEDKAPWKDGETKSLNIASSIASEIARLVTVEFESEIIGNDYLNEQYQVALKDIRRYVEYACAKGGIVFKPYVNDDCIEVDFVQADKFLPTAYNSRGEITGIVFVEFNKKGKYIYTRIEHHNLTDEGYYINNLAYMKEDNSRDEQSLGRRIPLTDIDDWADLEESILIKNIDRPLFSYFKVPIANTIDTSSPLGVSVYSRAIELIKEADIQYSRILWEFEGSELAIDVDSSAFRVDAKGKTTLPKGKERLYRTLELGEDSKWNTFSPEIRDTSLFNGLNNILKKIEFNCGLAYGTISDLQETDKTATEIKSSKQRSYSTVKDIQNSLENSLIDLAYALDTIAKIYNLSSNKSYEMSFSFDDSLVMDKDLELMSMLGDVSAGILRPEVYLARKYGLSEEEAIKLMPSYEDVVTSPYKGTEE
ncbi:MAG: phage portal protein [Paraclostridium sp.]